MNNRNTKPLLERVEEIKQWLTGRLGKIRDARKQRAAELKKLEAQRDKAKAAVDEIDEIVAGTGRTIAMYRKQIAECEKCINDCEANIADLRYQRQLSLDAVSSFERDRAKLWKTWVARMRLFQDGKVRRKRRDLEKLERRIEAKKRYAEETAKLPKVTAEEIAMGVTPELKAKELKAKELKEEVRAAASKKTEELPAAGGDAAISTP